MRHGTMMLLLVVIVLMMPLLNQHTSHAHRLNRAGPGAEPLEPMEPAHALDAPEQDTTTTQEPKQIAPANMFGDGRDGELWVAVAETVEINTVRVNVTASGRGAAPANSTGFQAGDLVLFHQTQGTANVGRYEFNTISSINSATSWTLTRSLQYAYNNTDGVAQVIKVPQYSVVHVMGGGQLTAPEWNGQTGGILVFLASEEVYVGGYLTMDSKGFKGGYGNSARPDGWTTSFCHYISGSGRQGQQGHSPLAEGGCSRANNGGGGGGGESYSQNTIWGSGGGGGYSTAGGNGVGNGAGAAGTTYGTADLSTIHLGSGGGGGGWGSNPYGGGRNSIQGSPYSGQAGGIILVYGRDITHINARSDGNVGGNSNLATYGGYAGGGGSGGSIKIVGSSISTNSGTPTILARGGAGGAGRLGNGGNGGAGRIRIEYCRSFSGDSNPTASVQRITTCPELAMTGVTITGADTGKTDTSYTFTANVAPDTALTPIQYTWEATGLSNVVHTGGGVSDTATFTWSTPGAKTVKVTAANSVGEVVASHAITVNAPPASVTMSGPTIGATGETYDFTATVSPDHATTPIAYTWQATGQDDLVHTGGSRTDTASFTWQTPGEKTITVTVSNSAGEAVGTTTITVSVPPTEVSLAGPLHGVVVTPYTFTATVSPSTTTTPIAYHWQATDQPDIQITDQMTSTAVMTWSLPGTKTITVTASNDSGSIHETHTITITAPPAAITLSGPDRGEIDTVHAWTATVNPPEVSVPLTYTWEVSDQPTVIHQRTQPTDTITLTWSTPGPRAITVTVANAEGTASMTHSMVVHMPPVAWTLMYYLSGDNPSQHAASEQLLNRLEDVANNPQVSLLVLWDQQGADNTNLYHIQHDTTGSIVSVPLEADWKHDEMNMGDPQTLHDFVQWSHEYYPATYSLLSIFDHGGGWVPEVAANLHETWMVSGAGLAWDETNRDYLSMHEIAMALQPVTERHGKEDIVVYDAGLMAMLESAYALKDTAAYLIASQNVLHNTFSQDRYVPSLDQRVSPALLATRIVEQHRFGIGQGGTISALDLSKLEGSDGILFHVETLAQALRAEDSRTNAAWMEITEIYTQVQKFDYDEDGSIEATREGFVAV